MLRLIPELYTWNPHSRETKAESSQARATLLSLANHKSTKLLSTQLYKKMPTPVTSQCLFSIRYFPPENASLSMYVLYTQVETEKHSIVFLNVG